MGLQCVGVSKLMTLDCLLLLVNFTLSVIPQVLVFALAEKLLRLPATWHITADLARLPVGAELGQNFLQPLRRDHG